MFNALIDLLRDIWTWLDPFVIVNEYELGVRVRCGKIHDRPVTRGLRWRWWGIDRIEIEPINERTIDLPTCYMKVGRQSRSVSANLVVQTVDPVLMWRKVFEHDQSVNRRAAGVLAGWVETGSKDTRELHRVIRRELRRWGVKLIRIERTTDVTLAMRGHMIEGSGMVLD